MGTPPQGVDISVRFYREKRFYRDNKEKDLQMARVTRLELAASAVTGRRSNQLSYTRAFEVRLITSFAPPVSTGFDAVKAHFCPFMQLVPSALR